MAELGAPLLQGVLTLGLGVVCLFLFATYGKRYFLYWSLAWGVYALRIGAILSFLTTEDPIWLYWHQVTTGWTALALLWAATVFSLQSRWRWRYCALLLFPPVWSYIAIYRLDDFFWAAGPAVLFLSLATVWTGIVFLRYDRRVGSLPAAVMAGALFLWALHHLDYPFLRARGVWNPWGYYLDLLFELTTGLGILLLVQEDLVRGLATLSSLSGDLTRATGGGDVLGALLERPLGLPGVQGTALVLGPNGSHPATVFRAAGSLVHWEGEAPPSGIEEALGVAESKGRPEVRHDLDDSHGRRPTVHRYLAALPVGNTDRSAALIVCSGTRDPFTALDTPFLQALGRQVAAALESVDLVRQLRARTEELADARSQGPGQAAIDFALSAEEAQGLTRLENLTPREREVVISVAAGLTNREIAESLGISPRTVETHRQSVTEKLGIRTVAGLTKIVMARGWDDQGNGRNGGIREDSAAQGSPEIPSP